MLINAYDLARFGLLTMHKGMWNGERIVSEEWIDLSTTPTDIQPTYGFMNFYLNTGRTQHPSSPEYVWTHTGAGSNLVYVDPTNELVIVSRWIQGGAFSEVVQTVIDAMGARAASN